MKKYLYICIVILYCGCKSKKTSIRPMDYALGKVSIQKIDYTPFEMQFILPVSEIENVKNIPITFKVRNLTKERLYISDPQFWSNTYISLSRRDNVILPKIKVKPDISQWLIYIAIDPQNELVIRYNTDLDRIFPLLNKGDYEITAAFTGYIKDETGTIMQSDKIVATKKIVIN